MKKTSVHILVGLAILVGSAFAQTAVAANGDYLKYLPVQDAGRVKPFDTFARESLALLWGKESYKGKGAADVVFSWMLAPEEWSSQQIIQVRHAGLREALQLDKQRIYYSATELSTNPRVGLQLQELRSKREVKEKLDPFFQAVQTLENQISLYHAIRLGMAMSVQPSDKTLEQNPTGRWAPVSELAGDAKDNFGVIIKAFAAEAGALNALTASATPENKDKLALARTGLKDAVEKFISHTEVKFPAYANRTRVNAEVHYNEFHPFMYAWIGYLLAALLFGAAFVNGKTRYLKGAWFFLIAAWLLHTYGFGLRVYIIERAPVTNMYEVVVWVAWGAVALAVILNRFWRSHILMVSATTVASLCLILCDLSSHVLDKSLTPLEPVLRDNFWLLTHVLMISLSYAAFFLSFFIGDICLLYFLKDEKRFEAQIAEAANAMYRAIQVGVVLLAGGVILGGIWADYSWGRFWGWDPKETWAFIALLGYIAILHGRLAGWLRNFGLAVTSVVAFSLVIMAAYGVNYVLGAGLHTYGFGAGGVEYVAAFVAVHLLFAIYVIVMRQSRLKSAKQISQK